MTDISIPYFEHSQRLPNLVLWLSRTLGNGAGWVVDRVNVNGNGYKHNIDFAEGRAAQESFATAFWSYLEQYLPQDLNKYSLNAADAVFETEDILLQRLNVTSRALQGGTQRVLITFRNVLGDLCRLFRPGQFPSILLEAERTVASRTLTDVILPALRLASQPAGSFERDEDKMGAFVEKLQQNRRQIELYAGLISGIKEAAEKRRLAQVRASHEKLASIVDRAADG